MAEALQLWDGALLLDDEALAIDPACCICGCDTVADCLPLSEIDEMRLTIPTGQLVLASEFPGWCIGGGINCPEDLGGAQTLSPPGWVAGWRYENPYLCRSLLGSWWRLITILGLYCSELTGQCSAQLTLWVGSIDPPLWSSEAWSWGATFDGRLTLPITLPFQWFTADYGPYGDWCPPYTGTPGAVTVEAAP